MDALEYYLRAAPSPQRTLDLFEGEWTSKFPKKYGNLRAGTVPLFGDDRLAWGIQQLGGVEGKTVLELGSLEGAHTWMLEVWGAAAVVAIEANSRAYLRSLIVKEILGLRRAQFLYGDCVEYLANDPGIFDICCASGLLYHMANPMQLLAAISGICNGIYLWTHYYDRDIIENTPTLKERFNSSQETEYEGFKHTLYHQDYGVDLQSQKFIGGQQSHSQWMSRQDILDGLEYLGFGDIQINFEIPDHPHGPSFSLTAVKTRNRVAPDRSSIGPGNNDGQSIREIEMQSRIQHLEAQVRQFVAPGENSGQSIREIEMRSRIQHLEAQVRQTQDRIAAMESSKFWKLRAQWFKLKSLLGLPTD